jgi:NDP-sugar pyrophosphorylase family protein
MPKRAVILAGGKGTRLRPYTVVLPKPLMPIGDYPILEVIVRQLVNAGFEHITMAVNHQADIIKAYFNSGTHWGVKIDYSLEKQPLGTMGPLRLIDDLPDDFLVLNGDVLTDLDFAAFHQNHTVSDAIFSISSCLRLQQSEFGILETDVASNLSGFIEKPVTYHEVSMGVYMLSRQVLEYVPVNQPFGFDHLMLALLKEKQPIKVRRHEGFWLDIGRPDDYVQAIDIFEEKRDLFLPCYAN